MVTASDSTPAPELHPGLAPAGNPSNVVRLAQAGLRIKARRQRFSAINFSFPLSDEEWAAEHLTAIRAAAKIIGQTSAELAETCETAEELRPGVNKEVADRLARSIAHLDTLMEVMKTARARLQAAAGQDDVRGCR